MIVLVEIFLLHAFAPQIQAEYKLKIDMKFIIIRTLNIKQLPPVFQSLTIAFISFSEV